MDRRTPLQVPGCEGRHAADHSYGGVATYGFPTVLAQIADFAFCQAILDRNQNDEDKAALYERLSLGLTIAVEELNKKA
jgi:hypothetical protein